MFRKLVNDFAYSPSTIEQLGTYATQLRREILIRETGLVFLGFSGIALAFTIFMSPEKSGAPIPDHVARLVENTIHELPRLSTGTIAIIFLVVLILSLLLYIRARQLSHELRAIRHAFNIGQIDGATSHVIARQSEFSKIMSAIRSDFNGTSRLTSQILHWRPIEIFLEILADAILRPVTLTTAAIVALIFTALMYILARYYGLTLADSEWLVGFGFGWIIGLIGDWLHEGFAKHPDDL